MYADGVAARARARAVCAGCPVLEPCRSWVMTGPERLPGGVAAGMSPAQRARIRAKSRRLPLAG
jgi:hypothetical protein